MKKIKENLFLLIIFISSISVAQVDTTKILFVADEMPSFPGGESEMMNFLKSNLKYPEAEREANIMGKCHITFVVEKNGALTAIKILKGILGGPGCDAEALRVVASMPNWNPGKQKGKEARVQVNLPIQFRLRSTDSIAETDTTYYSSAWTKSKKAEAIFYRIVLKHDNGYLVKDMNIKNNLPQMIAVCNTLDPLKKNGKCTLYHETGQKKEEGIYVRNKKEGVWNTWFENGQKKIKENYANDTLIGIRMEWDEDGKDSSVVECFKNGRYKNIHLSKNQVTLYNEYDVFYPIAEQAEFPGGEEAMRHFIVKNIVEMGYPRPERDAGITGTCYLTYVIEKDGSITGVQLLRGVPGGSGYNKLALAIVKKFPTWKTGKQFGKIVKVQFNLPIRFSLR